MSPQAIHTRSQLKN